MDSLENEVYNFIRIWILAIISLCYCFYISSRIPKGIFRLISLTPIFILFLYLPLTFSAAHRSGAIAFFLAWLANFKLLLFSFDKPPLSPPPPKLFYFISLASLPIRLTQTTSFQNKSKSKPKSKSKSKSKSRMKSPQRSILFAIKGLILALLYSSYGYKQYLHKYAVLAMYSVQLYIQLELILDLTAILARSIFRFQLEPQFNEPYLATSLQDFWGHRWNLMVTTILRPTVYYPIRRISSHILPPRWVYLPALLVVFVVSGLMHELIYYYLTRVAPTWEVTWFFILHGVALAVEVEAKKLVPEKTRLHPAVSGPLSLGFVAATAFWLFFPPLVRNGVYEKANEDNSKLLNIFKGLLPS